MMIEYCDNTLVEGDPGKTSKYSEGHIEYKCKLTKDFCVAHGFAMTANGVTEFLDYKFEIAERCPSYSLKGKTKMQITREKKEAKRKELTDQISRLQEELESL